MLQLLDQLIQQVLDTGWIPTPPPAKPGFSFAVPNADWLAKVKQGLDLQLNIYLYEVRENRDLRRLAWDVIEVPGPAVVESMPPAYLDCHYLLSAWSPAEDTAVTTPALDEHAVLAEALRVLLGHPEVTPAELGLVGGGPVFDQARVYLALAPPEAPRMLHEFWNTMQLPWRPAIQLVATAPLDLLRDTPPVGLVTTLVQRYTVLDSGQFEESIQFGGWVLNAADDSPIGGATVQRVATSGEVLAEATTDAQGRYTFAGLRGGTHQVRASAPGFAVLERDLTVPVAPPASPADQIFKLS